ncbi:MAG: hypothetical protein ACOYT8_05680 [Candidatus Dependentiae bacterium]
MKFNTITIALLSALAMSNGLVVAMAGDINPTPEMVQGFTKGAEYVKSVVNTPKIALTAPVSQSSVITEAAKAVVSLPEITAQNVPSEVAKLAEKTESVPSSWENIGEGFKALGSAGLHYVKATGKLIADLPWPNITKVFKNSCQDVQMFVNDVTKNKTIFVVTLALAGYGSYKLYNKVKTWYDHKKGLIAGHEVRQTETRHAVTRTEIHHQ